MRNHYLAGTLSKDNIRLEALHRSVPTVPKAWGEEEHIHNVNHCVKIMKLKPNHQVSMHWHSSKEETFILVSGCLTVESINQLGEKSITKLTEPLESFTLCKKTPHTFYCPDGQEEETVFIEASTTDNPYDSYRVEPSKERKPIIDR